MPGAAIEAVQAFNDAINRGDLDTLAALMSDDHRFVDPAGSVVAGKAACVAAWRVFFAAFPDYRNRFAVVTAIDDTQVSVEGRSDCSAPELTGPARWFVQVRDGLVTEWRVGEA